MFCGTDPEVNSWCFGVAAIKNHTPPDPCVVWCCRVRKQCLVAQTQKLMLAGQLTLCLFSPSMSNWSSCAVVYLCCFHQLDDRTLAVCILSVRKSPLPSTTASTRSRLDHFWRIFFARVVGRRRKVDGRLRILFLGYPLLCLERLCYCFIRIPI